MVNQITDNEYALLRDLVHRVSGISMVRLKREIIVSRLLKRLKELRIGRFGDYYELTLNDRDELSELINHICTNTTQFFREPMQFEFMDSTVLPEIMSENGRIRVWSAGCSTGEEPYSIAMAIQEVIGKRAYKRDHDIRILASDLSTKVLKKAEGGIYSSDEVSSVPPSFLHKYFLSGVGKYQGFYHVKKNIGDSIMFRRINLTGEEYPIKGMFDVILCRNVIIYFDKPTQSRVIDSLLCFLKPGGYLFCGHSESLMGQRGALSQVYPCVYQKKTA